MRPLELDSFGAESQRLVDDQVGDHGHDPGDGNVGIQAQHIAQRLKHIHLHQHERDQRVEQYPHHATRVAVRQAREEVAPGKGPGIGVRHVDLELRHHHEDRRGGHRPLKRGEHVFVSRQIHLVRIHRAVRRHAVADGEVSQQRTTQHLGHTEHHPTRTTQQHTQPPAAAVLRGLRRHEAQVVCLLPHLGNQRDAHRECGTKQVHIENTARAKLTAVVRDARKRVRVTHQNKAIGHKQHQQPHRLGPDLQAADGGDAVRDQRNHHQRADEVTPCRRNVQRQLQRIGHDGRLQREKNERERRIDQRGNGGADVAKARATGQQIHVHTVTRGVNADGQPRQKDHQTGDQNRPEGVYKAVLHQQRGPYGLQYQKRCRAKRSIGHPPFGPFAKPLRGVAQGIVLHGFAGHPVVVVTADLHHTLGRCFGLGGNVGRGKHTSMVQIPCHANFWFCISRVAGFAPCPPPFGLLLYLRKTRYPTDTARHRNCLIMPRPLPTTRARHGTYTT